MSEHNQPLTKRAKRLLYEMWTKQPSENADWSEVESIAMRNYDLMANNKLPDELFYSGKLLVRITPELHARMARAAGALSQLEFVKRAIQEAVERKEAERSKSQ